MDSWWELGEGFGYEGKDLQVWRITCPFCSEKGHFAPAFHGEKKKPGSEKRLNFEVLKCTNCAGFVHVLWSSSERSAFRSLYDYRVLPSPISSKPEPSESWPDGMRTYWIQAHDSLSNENWDAAAVMARSALQFVLRERGARKGSLNDEINDLAEKKILHPIMEEWSHEVRLLGRDSAHPELQSSPADPQDARDIVNFLDGQAGAKSKLSSRLIDAWFLKVENYRFKT